jgi:FO synthase
MTLEEVLAVARLGAEQGCTEALFTLGDKPELLYPVAAAELAGMGYASTLEYVAAAAAAVMRETGLLPHINAGEAGAGGGGDAGRCRAGDSTGRQVKDDRHDCCVHCAAWGTLCAGVMGREDVRLLKSVSASQGLMLESTLPALLLPGGAHHNCPDKVGDSKSMGSRARRLPCSSLSLSTVQLLARKKALPLFWEADCDGIYMYG